MIIDRVGITGFSSIEQISISDPSSTIANRLTDVFGHLCCNNYIYILNTNSAAAVLSIDSAWALLVGCRAGGPLTVRRQVFWLRRSFPQKCEPCEKLHRNQSCLRLSLAIRTRQCVSGGGFSGNTKPASNITAIHDNSDDLGIDCCGVAGYPWSGNS